MSLPSIPSPTSPTSFSALGNSGLQSIPATSNSNGIAVGNPFPANTSNVPILSTTTQAMPTSPLTLAANGTTPTTVNGVPDNDKRVRIGLLPGMLALKNLFYADPSNTLLAPLSQTNGVLFPFQPKVDISFSANYQTQKVVQNNFAFYHYENSEIKPITLSCEFPVRIPAEGAYVLAAITFLRGLTMMFTGNDGKLAGAPPLVAQLSGMGFGGLDSFPIIVTDVTTSYPDNVDYLTITLKQALPNERIKIPAVMTISVTCQPIFSRAFSTAFSTQKFASGAQRLHYASKAAAAPGV